MVKAYVYGFFYIFFLELSILLAFLMGYVFLWFVPLLIAIEYSLYCAVRRSCIAAKKRRAHARSLKKKKGHRPEPDGLSKKRSKCCLYCNTGAAESQGVML